MRYTLVLAALAALAACDGEPMPRNPANDALVWQMWGANNARYEQMRQTPPPAPIYMPQTVTYQRTGPGTVMAY